MNDRTTNLQQKLWEIERRNKSEKFSDFLLKNIEEHHFEIIDFDFSDDFIKNAENYPKNKYDRKLYLQIELNNENLVINEVIQFLKKIEKDYAFIFSYNYNFGLTKIQKKSIIENWKTFVEFDGDEIKIFNPENKKFLSIELTEEFMINKEEKGRIIFYELTPSE